MATTILLVLAGWTLLSLPLALAIAHVLASPGRHHPPYVVGAARLDDAISRETQEQNAS